MTDTHDTTSSVFYVYVHKTADTGNIFYVGKGCRNRAYSTNRRNVFWQRVVKKHGFIVEIIYSGLTEQDAFKIEIDTIYNLRLYGERLTNLTVGGEGASGYKWTEQQINAHKYLCRTNEYRQAASLRAKKFHSNLQVKARHSKSINDFWSSPDGQARRDFLSNSTASKERGKNISTANWANPIIRDKMLRTFRSAEYRKKLSENIKIAVNKPEAKENSRLARLVVGHKEKHSEEVKKALNTPIIRERHLAGLLNPETQMKIKNKVTETTRTDEYRKAASIRIKKSHSSPEVRAKISEKAKLRPTVSCPHCGKVTQPQNAARWHFDNCKHKS